MAEKQMFPTEVIELPSKGVLYLKESPLSSGSIEMKYMTAKEEDILTNQNYIENGSVIDKLLQSLIVNKEINYEDILVGDKNALLVAARVLGYGKDYEFQYGGETHTIDLSQLQNKEVDESLFKSGKNEFNFTLPHTKREITFKLLTHGDEVKIEQEVKGMKRINKNISPELSTRLKYMILSIDGNSETKAVREFIDREFLAMDSRAFRKYVQKIQPDVDLKFYPEGSEGGVDIPIGVSFFWPDAGV